MINKIKAFDKCTSDIIYIKMSEIPYTKILCWQGVKGFVELKSKEKK